LRSLRKKEKILMLKKILFTILLIVALSVTGCRGTEVEDISSGINEDEDGNNQETNEEGTKENEELKGFKIDKTGKNTKIVFENNDYFRGPRYSVKWGNGDNFIFSSQYSNNDNISNIFYNFNIYKGSIDKLFNIDGEMWGAGEIVEEGNEIIYSHNGFDGLYSLKKDGIVNQITKAQSWFHFSPDGKRIVINGIPADGSDDSEYKRYIYDVEKGLLEESSLIPNMDYVFSFIAARWSPDSIHISSQTGDKENRLTIINGAKNSLEKEIIIDDSLISFPIWSPDGKKLAFMVQTKDKGQYIIEGEELYFYMSDKIGIYDTEDNSVSYIDLDDQLTVNSPIWNEDSKGIFLQTVSTKMADKIIDRSMEGQKKIEINFNYLDLYSRKTINIFKNEAIMDYYNIPSVIHPIELHDQNKLLCPLFPQI